MRIFLDKNWKILQDVHDSIEKIGLSAIMDNNTRIQNQISEWEDLPALKHLQLILASDPYAGRELRYFNYAPWWYRHTFTVDDKYSYIRLTFTNVDYYCKVFVNGQLAGEHEGYSDRFDFDISQLIKKGEENILLVKVWSPWDEAVEGDEYQRRTSLVCRNMVKGTYEHSDGFLQRDTNPVGVYGHVWLDVFEDSYLKQESHSDYTVDASAKAVTIRVRPQIEHVRDGLACRVICRDWQTKEVVHDACFNKPVYEGVIQQIHLWNTWDRGGAYLYELKLELMADGKILDTFKTTLGFRTVELYRTPDETSLRLNGKKIFVRGTSYFPDQYISAMTEERYCRDLLQIKQAGFNLIRLHVHIDLPILYELCDVYGIAIMQDSEYNWMHPFEGDFAERFIKVYTRNIDQLRAHPSICIWVCMNEPGVFESNIEGMRDHMERCRAMAVHPGPMIYGAVRKADPSRPAIKGSYCYNDPESGDSHNYVGSLFGKHYLDVYGTSEKFNSEYGFDALPCEESLRKMPRVYQRLKHIVGEIEENQTYQYKYTKYMTEHYRLQKYSPCSGYIQFLFGDVVPESFYGVYDWYNIPKKGLLALMESNQPVAIMVKFGRDQIDGLYLVNDYEHALGKVDICYTVEKDGEIAMYHEIAQIGPDCILEVAKLNIFRDEVDVINIRIVVRNDNGDIITHNHYEDIFHQPEHPKGHPGRLSHELGCRLYHA